MNHSREKARLSGTLQAITSDGGKTFYKTRWDANKKAVAGNVESTAFLARTVFASVPPPAPGET